VALVTALAAGASVAANFALVRLATAFDPAIQHYSHFRFSDYGTLTVVGVICAGVAWYLATRSLAAPRHTFFRVAVVSMVVLWMPDVWLFIKHEPHDRPHHLQLVGVRRAGAAPRDECRVGASYTRRP
jgi:hypothetical protein